MKLNEIDTALLLREELNAAIKTRKATAGHLTIEFTYDGRKHDPLSVINGNYIRDAVKNACDACIAEKKARLLALGVDADETDKPA